MVSSQLFTLTSLALLTNLSLTGSFSRMYSNHPAFLGLKSSLPKSIFINKFSSFYTSSSLIYGSFNSVLLSNVHISHAMQPINIYKELVNFSLDYYKCRVTIKSCQFDNCYNTEATEMSDHQGGAISLESCQVSIVESTFDYCVAGFGGAIYVNNSKIVLRGVNFTSNYATFQGGAVLLCKSNFTVDYGFSRLNSALTHACFDIHESKGTLSNHHLLNNNAEEDCAGISVRESDVTIRMSYFIHNHANEYPGAIQIEEGDNDKPTSVRLFRCVFISNEAENEPINIQFYGNVNGTVERCAFDVDIKEAILLAKSPKVKYIRNNLNLVVKVPFKELIEDNSNIVSFERTLEHTRSDILSTLFILLIPIYVGIVFLILTMIK